MSATDAAIEISADWRADAGATRRRLDHHFFGVRELTLRRFGWTALFVAGFALWSTMGNLFAEDGLRPSLATFAKYLPTFIAKYALWLLPAMIAVSIADGLPLHGIRRTVTLAAALALGALISATAAPYVEPCVSDCAQLFDWRRVRGLLVRAVEVFAHTSAIAVAFFSHRRDQSIAVALHASELARVDAERARLNTVLQAMQARVEPVFLLEALQDVAARYTADRLAGGRMLDLLIQYLRSALPQMRKTYSTLEREATLLRSYLGFLAMRSDGTLVVACRFEPAVARALVPPMILLPLVASAAQHRAESGTLTVDAREIEGRVRIALAGQGAIARYIAQAPAPAEARERLLAIYGDRASLIVDRTDDAVQVIVEIPHERTDSGHR
jgi:Histidine kinase